MKIGQKKKKGPAAAAAEDQAPTEDEGLKEGSREGDQFIRIFAVGVKKR